MMANSTQFFFSEADWKKFGLKMLIFTRYWARTHYGWREGQVLPGGRSPEDLVIEVLVAFDSGARTLKPGLPTYVQLKSAIRSELWNLHCAQSNKRTSAQEPAVLELHLDTAPDPSAVAQLEDYWSTFFAALLRQPAVAKRPELTAVVEAFAKGAETVEELAEATGLSRPRISELKRQLKPIAEQVTAEIKEAKSHEVQIP